MTKTDLFKIILKLYGLYSVIELLIQLVNLINIGVFDSVMKFDYWLLLPPVVGGFITYIMLFMPELLVRLFRLDKGFDNNAVFGSDVTAKAVSKLAIMIVGVYLIAVNMGSFIIQLIYSFKSSIKHGNDSLINLVQIVQPNPYSFNELIYSGMYVLIGFLLVTNYTRISNWMERINVKTRVNKNYL